MKIDVKASTGFDMRCGPVRESLVTALVIRHSAELPDCMADGPTRPDEISHPIPSAITSETTTVRSARGRNAPPIRGTFMEACAWAPMFPVWRGRDVGQGAGTSRESNGGQRRSQCGADSHSNWNLSPHMPRVRLVSRRFARNYSWTFSS